MEIEWSLKLIVLFCLLLFSAFFSGSEVALFSIDQKKVKKHHRKNSVINNYLISIISHPRKALVTILVGNTIVNVAASIVAVMLAIEYSQFSNYSLSIVLVFQIILLTVLILLFGELIPKVLASKNPMVFARTVAIPLYWIYVVLFPLSELITESIKILTSKIRFSKSRSVISEDELTELAEVGQETGSIIEEEQEIISSLVDFKSVQVSEIMTPRVDIVAIPKDSRYEDVIGVITKSGHSRLPLYTDDLDNVVGILNAKDLLRFVQDEKLKIHFDLTKMSRDPIFVPKTKMINDMLHIFQEKKMHMAIVVDEYGGTAGLITLEDIIEEVVGEIWDEFDTEESAVKEIGENQFLVLGKATIDDLNELVGKQIVTENENYDTVGGLIFHQAGEIPKEGYSFLFGEYRFTVKEILKKRVKKVLVNKETSIKKE